MTAAETVHSHLIAANNMVRPLTISVAEGFQSWTFSYGEYV